MTVHASFREGDDQTRRPSKIDEANRADDAKKTWTSIIGTIEEVGAAGREPEEGGQGVVFPQSSVAV